MTNRIGQRLGNYRLSEFLGRGGFGEVYLGEHVFLKTPAAIKVLNMQLKQNDLQGFLNEARTIANLVHPHIVRVLEFGVEGSAIEADSGNFEHGIPFLAMDYAPNGTIRQLYPKGTCLPLSVILSYVKQITEALQYAHSQRLIHRDIKPENMLIGRDSELLLSDFGLATIAQPTDHQNKQKVVGTIHYMSPEQLQGKPRFASDQYSLGIVVYEWLCGDRPFHGSFTAIAIQHIQTPPPSLHEKVPELPPAMEEVVLRALAKDPHQRFASIQAFANALEQAGRTELSSPSAYSIPGSPPPKPANLLAPVVSPPSFEQPPSNPQPPQSNGGSASKTHPQRLSRRVLIGLAAASVVGVAGAGATWLIRSQELQKLFGSTPHSTLTPTPSLTPVGSPIGTTFLIYQGHSSSPYGVYAVAWSPDGKYIASAASDGTVQVWKSTTGNTILTYGGHTSEVASVGWAPDGKSIASGSYDGTVQVWESITGNTLLTYRGHTPGYAVWAVAWSPDGKRIASSCSDQTIYIWDAATGKHLNTLYQGTSGSVNGVAWSPDGARTAFGVGSPNRLVKVLDIASMSTISSYSSYGGGNVAWSRDGKLIVSIGRFPGRTVQVWDAATADTILTYRGHSAPVQAVAWSPNGKRIASGGDDKMVQVWDATTGGNAFTYHGHIYTVYSVAWSPDGRRIASASADKTVQVWWAA